MSLNFIPMLAAAAVELTPEDLKTSKTVARGMQAMDLLLIIAIALLLLTALVCWAIFIRKPTSETRTRIHRSRPRVEETDDGTIRKRKKHKSPRREHRQRNPTLSEAGGLPPVRPDGSSPPI
jgi:hypothetical protein